MSGPLKILIAGCGRMGQNHALAYHHMEAFDICGIVTIPHDKTGEMPRPLQQYPLFQDYFSALAQIRPDVVSINTYPDTHAAYALAALTAGCHVFVEKPLACNLDDARAVVAASKRAKRTLLVGYLLRYHPVYQRLVSLARKMEGPYAMRMSLNKPSFGPAWERHRNIITKVSPLVDGGVHYIDLMRQVTGLSPTRISAAGIRMREDTPPESYDYGQLSLVFADGSMGWFEAGWGPAAPKTGAVREICTGSGTVNLLEPVISMPKIEAVTPKFLLQVFSLDKTPRIEKYPQPSLEVLCRWEQEFFLKAIESRLDLSSHHNDVLDSLSSVLAADTIIRSDHTHSTSLTPAEKVKKRQAKILSIPI